MLHNGLQIRTGQQLTVTPQLQRAIRLLQLSSIELDGELQQALDDNVFLETEEADEIGDSGGAERETVGPAASASPGGVLPEREQAAPDADLHAHLAWQLGMSSLSERDLQIAELIIDALDEDGLLAADPDGLRRLVPGAPANAAEFEAVRQVIMGLDPVGCGAVDIAECLSVQLRRRELSSKVREAADALLALGLESLAGADTEELAASIGENAATVCAAMEALRLLDPRPGRRYGAVDAEYIVPDVVVRQCRGRWVVELNPQVLPRLRVNELYERLMAEQAEGHRAMHGQLQEARWLVRSVQMRNETLLKVAGAIMRHQSGFLEHGEIAMRPMVLEEIAAAVGMHESTVSRVTTRKYIHTPRGNFELKYFFSSRLGTRNGGRCSSTAVRALIRRIVEGEEAGQPLSDGRIARLLSERGVRIARRTVAKYREAMGIPPVAERLLAVERGERIAAHH
ncbi:RNA polymerase factor sigma-54 [Wenzhouxiangella sp. AB-CW3]|uniref:RNA polymerase factor sigma-54 n=1 Tax=Wenzhouxiangella sp. AB-CW3 TaxID=2771012 RepID=UPI001CC3003C|nr:RNA polymerase factor sigma-54 [Wenzhouxiangella sp. AB-CW3]